MSQQTLTVCDRCGEIAKADLDEREGPVSVAITLPYDEDGIKVDLCSGCFEGLSQYLNGSKIARTRKAKA